MWQYVHSPRKRRDHPFNHMYFIITTDTTTRPCCPWALQCNKKLVSPLLWNCVHLFVLFQSLIPVWVYRKACVHCIPRDAKSRHEKDKQHLFTLKNSSRNAAMVDMQAEQNSKVSLLHCNPQYVLEVLEIPSILT